MIPALTSIWNARRMLCESGTMMETSRFAAPGRINGWRAVEIIRLRPGHRRIDPRILYKKFTDDAGFSTDFSGVICYNKGYVPYGMAACFDWAAEFYE